MDNTSTSNKNKKQELMFLDVLEELRIIRSEIEKLLVLIPEESLKNYKNPSNIKRAYLDALKSYPL